MFYIILTFAFFATYVSAEPIPSFIHVCGRKDPNINQCITDNAYNIRNQLCKGIPEMEIPSLEPLFIPQLIIANTNNIKLYTDKAQVMGVCNFVANDVDVDLKNEDKLKLYFNISLNNILLNSTYNFDMHLIMALATKGNFLIKADNAIAILNGNLKLATKNGNKYLYVSKIMTKLIVGNIKSKFENDSDQLRDIIMNIVGTNEKEIISTFVPLLEEAVSKLFITTVNNMLKHFTYDEILPDRT